MVTTGEVEARSVPAARSRHGALDPDAPVVAAGALALVGHLESTDSPADVLDLVVLEAFASGRQPFARTRDLENVRSEASLTPEGATLARETRTTTQASRLATGPGWTLHAAQWLRSRRAQVTVTATSPQLAETVLAQAVDGAVAPRRPQHSSVLVDFWHLTPRGPQRTPRRLEAAAWSQVRHNYPAAAAAGVDALVGLVPETLQGRLLVAYGPPGTGKTTLLRTLARQWRAWCRLDCVLDPERLLEDPSYLLDVALGEDDVEEEEDEDEDEDEAPGEPGARPGRWHMLLLEDCDELIRGSGAGAGHLSRLLNLTDGLLGQGRRVLVAMTTNADVIALNPAVLRPGRSLARVEVGRFGRVEAHAWLRREQAADGCDPARASAELAAVSPAGATLAELLAIRAGRPASAPREDGVGLYL